METLCWECKNCRCDWFEWGKPVAGWLAVPHKEVGQSKRYDGANPKSYTVIECPEKI